MPGGVALFDCGLLAERGAVEMGERRNPLFQIPWAEDRILALILQGEPNASDNPGKAAKECFPPALRYRVQGEETTSTRVEPLGGDLRSVAMAGAVPAQGGPPA